MCRKIIVVNELYLGARQLGWEAYSLPKGEIVEFTDKQLRNLILTGKEEVYGLIISEETGELIPDTENFYCRNWMVKSHINSLIPKFENDSLVYCDLYSIKFITISTTGTYAMNNRYW